MGSRPLVTVGFALISVGLLVLAGLGVAAGWAALLAGMALVGLGQGLFSVPNARAILGAVRDDRLGLASGMQATMRNLGFSAGAALGGALLESRFRAHGGTVLGGHLAAPERLAFAGATADTYKALAAMALVATGLAWWGGRPRESEAPTV
jgi:MFS family permease